MLIALIQPYGITISYDNNFLSFWRFYLTNDLCILLQILTNVLQIFNCQCKVILLNFKIEKIISQNIKLNGI